MLKLNKHKILLSYMDFTKITNNFYLLREKFKFQFFNFIKELSIRIYFISIAFVNILEWLLAKYILKEAPSKMIALHYNVDFGIDYYDSAEKIYILPILGAFIMLINLLLSMMFFRHKSYKFIFHLLLSIALFANIILLSALISIYLVNFA